MKKITKEMLSCEDILKDIKSGNGYEVARN